MIEVFSNKSLAQEYTSLAEYCNEILKDICTYEDFSFLNDIELTITFEAKKEGTARREKILGNETILINSHFLMHIRLIFRRILMSEFATLDQRCDGILQSLQEISLLQLNQWHSCTLGCVRPQKYSFQPRDKESLISTLTSISELFDTINKYILTNSEKFDEWWNLFTVFLILHEIGHVLWGRGIKSHIFWNISQDILQKKHDEWLASPFKTDFIKDVLSDSASSVREDIFEEMFCDSIASGACSTRLNKILSVEEMRCALLMYGDIFDFLSGIDAIVRQDIFLTENKINLSHERMKLFRDLLDYIISERGIWPKYTQRSGGAITHVYSFDYYFLRFWVNSSFSTFLFQSRNARQNITLTNEEINQAAAELRIPYSLVEDFICSDRFLSAHHADRLVFTHELSMKRREWLILKQLLSDGRAHEYSHTLSAQQKEAVEQVLDLRTRAEALDLIDKRMFLAAESYWDRAKTLKFGELIRYKSDQSRLKFKNREYCFYIEIAGKIAQMCGDYARAANYAQKTYELVENDTLLSQYKDRYLYDIAYAKWRKGSRDDDDSAIQESIQISRQAEQSAEEVGHFFLSFSIKYLIIENCKWLAIKKYSEKNLETAISLLKEIESALEEGKIGNMFDIVFIRNSISELQSISLQQL
ncbi:MAG: hypothetical protein KME57_21160 [Scytonema hyalinum WJT4-NPBG1]|jgi:tetratricopeptide (TPR) repeat protein|nr:hypothetical protein [Scytonema hyalinum WJT4-NPBG1]